ncbi:hypothetical protein [Aequorivita nionensis]|uniref:hypothetical protein n=1 Tax=Aequorivita nionensis TaxID=1287690 RepID=UPI003965BE0F
MILKNKLNYVTRFDIFKILISIALIFVITACSSEDDTETTTDNNEINYYEVTLRLQAIEGAGYNTILRINTFQDPSPPLRVVQENDGDIEWINGTIEHTFVVDAKTASGIQITEIDCSTSATLHQDYFYAIDSFNFTVIIKDDNGNVISEQSTDEDTIEGPLQFTARIILEIE